MKTDPVWKTAPISCTCEVTVREGSEMEYRQLCDAPTTHAYPAMGGGWMALCRRHATKHITNGQSSAISTDELIKRGEKWK